MTHFNWRWLAARNTGSTAIKLSAALVLIGLMSGPGISQAVTVDNTGACPADLRIQGTDYFTIVSGPDLYTAEDSDVLVDNSISEKLLMHTRLHKIKESRFRTFFMTKRKLNNGQRICGWMQAKPSRNADPTTPEDAISWLAPKITVGNLVEWTDPVTNKIQRQENPLPLKAVLRSNPESDTANATLVKIYDKPTLSSRARTEAKVFGVYYIYSERLLDEGIWYWIAGNEPNTQTRFAGWVPESHVVLWGSQLSLYFNEKAESTGIYLDARMARRDDKSAIISRRPAGFVERTIGPPRGSANNIAKFPIIDTYESDRRGETIYQVAYFGDDKGVERSSDRAKIGQSIKNIDILFLLDNTKSMTEYFPYVVEGVKNSTRLIARANRENGFTVKVKYAAAVYGDYRGSANSVENLEFDIVANLGADGYTEHLRKLERLAASGQPYGDQTYRDLPEGGLAGIVRGVNELDWSSNSGLKVIVWIGDHGSREPGASEGVSVPDVREVLASKNVLLFPINVSGRYDRHWNTRFIEQGSQLTISELQTRITHNNAQSNDFAAARADIEQSISNMYLSSVTAGIAITEGLNINQTISDRPDLFELGIPAAQADVTAISSAICEQAFGNQGCANLQDTGQFMSEGFVRFDERLKNYSFWVNLTQRQLEILQIILSNTCRGFDGGGASVKKQLERAMLQVQHAFSLDEEYSTDIPLGLYLRRFLFLPSQHFPSFLESTPDRIAEAWEAARQKDRGEFEYTGPIADPICRSAKLIDLVLDSKRVEDINTDIQPSRLVDDRAAYSWSVADNSKMHDFDWEWAQGGENNYYYIPTEYLPGNITQ